MLRAASTMFPDTRSGVPLGQAVAGAVGVVSALRVAMDLEPLLLGPVTVAADGCLHPATRDVLSALTGQRSATAVEGCGLCSVQCVAVKCPS